MYKLEEEFRYLLQTVIIRQH